MIDNYNDLTVGKWIELRDIDTEGQEEIDIQLAVLSILSDRPVEEIMELPLTEYSVLVEGSKFLSDEPQSPKKLPNKITINNKEYDIVTRINTITAGQYIDYQTYLKTNDLPHILTCFIVPKGFKYGDGYDLEDVANEIKEYLPIGIALGISRFFFVLWVTSMQNILDSSIKKLKKVARKTKNKELKKKLAVLKRL